MIIDVEVYEQIRYLYEQEGLSQRDIAKNLVFQEQLLKSIIWVKLFHGKEMAPAEGIHIC